MIEINRVRLAFNLFGCWTQEVDVLLVQDLALLKASQGVAMRLQGLGWGHSFRPHAVTGTCCTGLNCTASRATPAQGLAMNV